MNTFYLTPCLFSGRKIKKKGSINIKKDSTSCQRFFQKTDIVSFTVNLNWTDAIWSCIHRKNRLGTWLRSMTKKKKKIIFNNSAQAGAPRFVFGTKAPFAFEELMAHRVPRVTLPFALCCVRHRYKSLGIHRWETM